MVTAVRLLHCLSEDPTTVKGNERANLPMELLTVEAISYLASAASVPLALLDVRMLYSLSHPKLKREIGVPRP